MELGDLRHADNGIHRRADIVRHGGEKPRFCLVGVLGHIDGAAQVLVDGEDDDHADLGERELGGKGPGILQILHRNEAQKQIGAVGAVRLADHHTRSHADDRPL